MLTFFLQHFWRTAPCPPWMDKDKWNTEILPLELSDAESARFLRALCRMQTYCNTFGKQGDYWRHAADQKTTEISLGRPWYRNEEIWELFLNTMPPWEAEEMACVFGRISGLNGLKYLPRLRMMCLNTVLE
ncbi:conserved hypothetical protein [Coccidioides posadasii str. Silveira]|uniref:Uncharacterized protein n=1 Tax=Coccidioides posadasii (strain RMSCC 757 / Silveira) TaxID=443226 RepID=E9D6U1_COCPS|nr:conserved hypothetical protein [Coccidioides posadasii str. Silveira]